MMETLYDDNNYYYPSTMNSNVNQLKRKMTLDLDNNKTSVIKKAKMFGGLQTPVSATVLSSPDLNMLKLASPELERFIISNQNLVTTTPTQVFFPRNVTEEQELYAKGFAEALAQLHNNPSHTNNSNNVINNHLLNNNVNNNNSNSSSNNQHQQSYNESSNSSSDSMSDQSESNSSSSYTTNGQLTTLGYGNNAHHHHPSSSNITTGPNTNNPNVPRLGGDYYNPNMSVHVKEEPQTVPTVSTPPMSPIDMASQEKIKLERKRQRNRVAASKCRKRKLERISKLEDKVKQLKGENSDLTNVLSKLKENVNLLKQQVMEHVHNGCQIMISSNMSSF